MPEWKQEIRGRLAGLGLDPTREAEIVDELAQHLDDRYEEMRAKGAAEEEAHRAALLELSDNRLLTRELRRSERPVKSEAIVLGAGRSNLLSDLFQDIRYGIRILLKNPGFTVVAVLTIALGIGANTAIFSVIHAVLLRPLPYPDPDRLVLLAETTRDERRTTVAYPNYRDWEERAQSFEDMAPYQTQSFNLTGVDHPMRLQGRRVGWRFFHLLGATPQQGRLFIEEDDRPGAPPTAVISNGLWREQFGGDPEAIGRTIKIDGVMHTLIGVLQPEFMFTRRDDLFLPMGISLTPDAGILHRGNHYNLFGVARLKDGVTIEQAGEEMKAIAAQLEQEYPNTNSGNGAMAQGLSDVFVEDVRPALIVLAAAVGFVLLIACVNVANLMLVRAAERHKEIAVRLALGAARGRIIRQLISESLLISVLGGGAGLLIGVWVMSGLVALSPPDVPRLEDVRLNETVLIFTIGVSLVTGLLFGLLPALQASKTDLQATLKEGGRHSAGALRERTRKLLLVAEVSLALVLLIGAGLMLRTVSRLTSVDPGFDADNLLMMRFILSGDAYTADRRRSFYEECLSRVKTLPGVESVSVSLSVPIEGSNWNSVFIVADKPVPARADLPSSAFTPVSLDYFKTLRIRLLKGRTFTESDGPNSPRVVVINETFANRLWPGEDPIGKKLKQGWPEDDHPWREVIGLVADVKTNGIDRDTPIQAYLPLVQEPARSVVVVARTSGDPLMYGPTIEQTIRSIDRELPVFGTRSMDQLMGSAIAQQRLTMTLLGGFAVLALTLAAVGIYGVMSYAVAQRTHEIGIRMAMGATASDVFRLVVGQGMLLAVIGAAIGLFASIGLTRLMSSLLFGVSATDPFTFIILTLLLTAVAFIACYLPARRATRVDPLVALRHE